MPSSVINCGIFFNTILYKENLARFVFCVVLFIPFSFNISLPAHHLLINNILYVQYRFFSGTPKSSPVWFLTGLKILLSISQNIDRACRYWSKFFVDKMHLNTSICSKVKYAHFQHFLRDGSIS
jgi:hypothetical protein